MTRDPVSSLALERAALLSSTSRSSLRRVHVRP
jgi:hypothetical protein